MKKFFLYLIRWQLSSPILAVCMVWMGGWNVAVATIVANLIGGCIFFWVDKWIFGDKKARSRKKKIAAGTEELARAEVVVGDEKDLSQLVLAVQRTEQPWNLPRPEPVGVILVLLKTKPRALFVPSPILSQQQPQLPKNTSEPPPMRPNNEK